MCVPVFPIEKPKAPKPLEKTNVAVKDVSTEQRNARREDRKRANAAFGRRSTILTGQSGLSSRGSIQQNKLLGE